eukprot:1190064-Prorocentrum_minimum.AAC.4
MDQSDTGNPAVRLDTDTVELTVKTLLSHLITREFNSPTNSLRTQYVRVEPYPALEGTGGSRSVANGS